MNQAGRDRALNSTIFIQIALWIAMFGAMIGSIRHVAWSFSTLSGDIRWGYIQAIATDMGIAALAFGIQLRKRQGRKVWTLWVIMTVFAGISTYANLLYGIAHLTDIGVGELARWRPFIMSAVLPFMVLSLAEVVSEDLQYTAQEAEKAERKRQREQQRREQLADVFSGQGDTVQFTGGDIEKDDALDMLVTAVSENPEIPITHLATLIGKSRTTVYNYLGDLEQAGRVTRLDSGVFRVNGGHSERTIRRDKADLGID